MKKNVVGFLVLLLVTGLIYFQLGENETVQKLICKIPIPSIKEASVNIYLTQEWMEPNGTLYYEISIHNQIVNPKTWFSGINGTTQETDFKMYNYGKLVGLAWLKEEELVVIYDFEKQSGFPEYGNVHNTTKGKKMLLDLQEFNPDLKLKY